MSQLVPVDHRRGPETLTPTQGGRGQGPARHLDELSADAERFAAASRSPATLRAYRSDFAHFSRWCTERDLNALPADATTVALYVTELADGFKPSTITRRLASISVAHRSAGHRSPTEDATVRAVASGVRRTLGTAVDEAAPLLLGDLRQLLAHLPDDVSGVRDRAALLVGFAGALRSSELVGLDVEDLTERPEGLQARLRRSKTDQEAAGELVALPHGADPHTCPVRAVRAWRDAARVTAGPLLRPIDRHGNDGQRRLTAQSITLLIRRAATRANMDPSRYSGHSLRAGFATAAAAAGASEEAIARQTRHRSREVLRRYVRHGSIFTSNAVNMVGL